MLQINGVSYAVAGRQILNDVSFTVSTGEKVALVGSNGAGKTTLVQIIMGEIPADEGSVKRPDKTGYVPQMITDQLLVREGCTVEEFMLEGRGLNELARQMQEALEAQGGDLTPEELDRFIAIYSDAHEEFMEKGGYSAETEIETLLHGIGLHLELDRVVITLSGGEKTRLAFARIIFGESDLLILDEPTNHIDRQYYSWLGGYLRQLNKTVLVVSHHPEFINAFTSKIVEVEKYTGRVREYKGSYQDYLAQSATTERTILAQAAWMDKEIKRLDESARRLQYGGPNRANAAQNMFGRIDRLKQEREELMGELPRHERPLRLTLPVQCPSGQEVVSARGVSKAFDHPIFHDVSFVVKRGSRVIVLGPNGSGKTTLVKVLVGAIRPDEGEIVAGHNVLIGYYSQEHETLNTENTILEEASQACYEPKGNLRDILGRFLFTQDKVFQKVGTLSQGEKSRLQLCKLILGGFNLLVLDEPTNYLDPSGRKAVIDALIDYEGTLIVVSHDRAFVTGIKPDLAIVMPEGAMTVFDERLISDDVE